MTRRLVVVTAGLSQPSSTRLLADRLSAATTTALRSRGLTADLDVIELRDLAHEVADHLLTGFPSGRLRAALQSLAAADGLIAVTPVFTASYSGLFKSFFDVVEAEALTDLPVVVAATGGTERHSLVLEHALRPLFSYLRAVVVPTAVYAASSDWGGLDEGTDRLDGRIRHAAEQLADLMKNDPRRTPADPFTHVTPFERLLSGE